MSAWKPLAVSLVICGVFGTTANADPIPWPSGLDNWLIYLAAPSGSQGTGPVSYTVPSPAVITPQVPTASPVSAAPAAAQAVISSPAPPQPAPVSVSISSPPAPSQSAPNPPQNYVPPAPSQQAPAQVAAYTPPAPVQPSMVQPVTYIHPMTSQPASVQPVMYTPPAVLSNVPATASQPSVAAPSALVAAAAPSPATASAPAQAFINVGSGPYPQSAAITTGGASPWYNSSQLTSFFGGQPTAQQIQSFDNAILQRVQQTFSQSGISVTLTENPNAPALHTVSLVSNTASATLSNAIGMTQVGGNGFSFIDQIAPSAHSLDQLEWVVAHNISHELMLAFGVPENYDTTGNYIDSKLANWAMMVNPNSTFTTDASQAINQALASQTQTDSTGQLGAQAFDPSPAAIPEPTTVAMWGLAAIVLVVSRRRSWHRNQGRRIETCS